METIFKLFVSTVCLWSVTGFPRKLSDSETNGLQQKHYESKPMVFSSDSIRNVESRFRQFQEESDWTNQLVEKPDKWNTRQKRAVRRNSVPKGEEIPNQSQLNSRRHGTANRKGTQRRNHPKKIRSNTLPEHEKDFKQPLRQILILGTKQADKKSTKKKSIGPSGSRRRTPKRKGSFSIVPAKPKPKPRRFPIRRGWRSRLRSRARARAMGKSRARSSSQTPKPKRIIRKTVRRGFVVLD
ncbi:uncharacterized protein [Argopecten irradians]|uniref:uncharacterized protein n=1 Tax=Argopecten irradians TaxID=31199 RepID=UPI00371D5EE2